VTRDYGSCLTADGTLKVKFGTKRVAKGVIRRSRKKKVFTAYWCPTCGYWHLGTSKRRKRRRDE
jgi:predicted RNA-binding Zn-ribbon protein involved in translation (DUF1610 family)